MNMKVDWAGHFDRVYCIHYLPQTRKLPRLMSELRRVGLEDSGILEMRNTMPSVHDGILFNCIGEKRRATNAGCVNLGLETVRMMKEAMAKGYGRIMVLENDVAFLSDLGEIEETIAMMPDREVVQFDKFVTPGGETTYVWRQENKAINGRFFDPEGDVYYSGACYAVGREAMRVIVERMEGEIGPCATDSLFADIGLTRAIAAKNMAIQLVYGGSISADAWGINSHHDGYKRADVVYMDYELPAGYGYGKAL